MHGNNSVTEPTETFHCHVLQHMYLTSSSITTPSSHLCFCWLDAVCLTVTCCDSMPLYHTSQINYSFNSNGVRWYYSMWKALTFLYPQCHIHVNLMCSLSYIPIRTELVKTWHLRTENGTPMPKDSEKHFTCITIF